MGLLEFKVVWSKRARGALSMQSGQAPAVLSLRNNAPAPFRSAAYNSPIARGRSWHNPRNVILATSSPFNSGLVAKYAPDLSRSILIFASRGEGDPLVWLMLIQKPRTCCPSGEFCAGLSPLVTCAVLVSSRPTADGSGPNRSSDAHWAKLM